MTYLKLTALLLLLNALASTTALSYDNKISKYLNDTEHINAQGETAKYYWAGTNHGLYYIKKKGGSVFHMTRANSILQSDTVTSIATTTSGEVYIGTRKGIVRYDRYTFLPVSTENSSLRSDIITSLTCLGGNEIYAGTLGGGITVFSGSYSRTFTTQNSTLQNDLIIAIEKVSSDSIIVSLGNNSRVGFRNNRFSPIKCNGK